MPHLQQLYTFVGAALLLAIMPGPGIFYVAARALVGGGSEGIASSLGTGVGGMFHAFAGSIGVSAIVLASAQLFSVLKLVGAAYLVWLGFRTIMAARREKLSELNGGGSEPRIGPRKAFREGIVVEAFNPKTAAFFLAFIPQFVDVKVGPVALQFVVLGTVSVILNTLADVAVVFAANKLRQGASTHQGLIRRLREFSGGAMIALGVGLALAKRPAT